MRSRLPQITLIVSFLAVCWLVMQVVHELGHVAGAVVAGGTIERVVLHPLAFSRTDVAFNPHPLAQVWAGPIVGVILPLIVWAIARAARAEMDKLFRFFAGFCCIANGAYIGFGPNSAGLDTQVMLSLGCQRWQLLAFGIPMIAVGLWLFNGTGQAFGLGEKRGRVSRRAVVASVSLLLAIVVLELLFAGT